MWVSVYDGVDVLLLVAAIVTFARRRSHLSAVVLLLALSVPWSWGVAALRLADLAHTPLQEALASVFGGLPFWAALVLGLGRLLAAEPAGPVGGARP